jgi:hypothetical protein
MKGEYLNIPKHFSNELQEAIGYCLTLNPSLRYSACDLLDLKSFSKVTDVMQKVTDYNSTSIRSQSENKSCLNHEMLGTIRLPKNLGNLNNGMLP